MLRSKLKKKLPAITFLGKLSQQQDINELFKPVKTLNFDHENEENTDYEEERWKGKHGGRFRKKYNENKKLVSKLTSEYRSALMEVRMEMEESRPFLSESIDELQLIISNLKYNTNVDDFSHVKIEDPIEISDYLVGSNIEEDEEDSQTWIILRAHCKEKNYEDPDGFEKPGQLLERPQVEWNVFNKSVMKCHEWLNKT
ncbi:hypothetical protein WA026_014732 [Henosepilachna vigintioctopunctata]|uniref:Uncharacterized protein n=1 Tax=Henosepilachna vigintioctopunctata TaxID=420089 RepID=A0AAW1VCU7_9CUCU